MLKLLLRRCLPVALVAVVIAAGSAPAFATRAAARPDKSVNQQMSELQELIDESSGEQAAALRQYAEAKQRKDAADARVADASARTASAQSVLSQAEAELDSAQRQIADTERRITETEAAKAKAASTFIAAAQRRYAAAASSDSGTFDASDFADVADYQTSQQYLRLVISREDQEVKRFLALNEDAKVARVELEAQKKAADDARGKAQTERDRLLAIQREEEAARAVVAQEAAVEKRAVDAVTAQKATYEKQLKELQDASDAIARQLSRGTGITVPKGSGQFGRPVDGPISSLFGPRMHPIFRTMRMHTGIDFGVSIGTPIRAAGDGICVNNGVMGGYGNVVLIDHGNGLATLYAHQSRTACAVGTRVKRGQVIGYVGNTGNSTGPHLHFEVRANGTPVNPIPYL